MDLITQIKKALETAGLDVALAEKIKITDASQINAEIEKLKEKTELTEEQFMDAIKKSGLENSLAQYVQRTGDKRVSEGILSFQKNQEKKNLSDKERLEAVEAELKELKDKTAKENTKTLIETELVKQNLSKGLLKYVKVNDISEIAGSVTALKDDLLKVEQEKIDEKLKGGDIPSKGETTMGDSVTEKYVENKNAGKIVGNPFEGKLNEGKSENKKGE